MELPSLENDCDGENDEPIIEINDDEVDSVVVELDAATASNDTGVLTEKYIFFNNVSYF